MEKQVYEIEIKQRAREDVKNQYEYFSENYSEKYAERFLEEFIEQTERILPFVWVYPECLFLPTKNHIYRNIVWGNYLIIYKILKKQIWVVGLFHTKQNPQKIKSYRRVK